MPYQYGMKSSPAVGNGLGGLPLRSGDIGEIRAFTYNPGGNWLLCDGTAKLTADYPQLAAKVGSSAMGRKTTRTANSGYNTTSLASMDSTKDGQTILMSFSGTNIIRASTNFGQTWTSGPTSPAGTTSTPYIEHAGNNNWILRTGGGSVLYQSIGLAAWTTAVTVTGYGVLCSANDGNGTVLTFWYDTASIATLRVYRSTNYGVSFTLAATISLGTTGYTVSDACYDGVGNFYFVTTFGDVYKSSNSGSNWTQLPDPVGIGISTGLSVAAQGDVVVISEGGTSGTQDVVISRDGGNTWASVLSVGTLAQSFSTVTNGRGGWAILSNVGDIYVSVDDWRSYFIYKISTGNTSQYAILMNDNGIYAGLLGEFRASEYVSPEFFAPLLTAPSNVGTQYYIKAR